jgi:transcriptional regulator with XRE-family HTH domain
MKKEGLTILEPTPRRSSEADVILGANIKKYRLMRNLTQSELADSLGITFQQIQKYEKGTNRIATSTLIRLARILDVNYTLLIDPVVEKMNFPQKQENLSEKKERQTIEKLLKVKNPKHRAKVISILQTLLDE